MKTQSFARDATRREVLRSMLLGAIGAPLLAQSSPGIQTVTGKITAADLGVTLMHEHIITDLRNPKDRKPGDYDRADAIKVSLPHLEELRKAGCRSFVEITPIYIGRDVVALKTLAEKSGLQIVCATGIYGAADQIYIPDYARTESAEQLAERFTREFREGIDGSAVKPGIIKTGVNEKAPLPEIERKLVRAAALAHKQTGLTVASHTGPGAPALEELKIFAAAAVDPKFFIWVHAQVEKDPAIHRQVAKEGAWVEFDGIHPNSIDRNVALVRGMAEAGLLHRTLISQDAGWYRPGEPGGGKFRGFTSVFSEFLPKLRASGFSQSEVDQLLVKNPAAALTGSA